MRQRDTKRHNETQHSLEIICALKMAAGCGRHLESSTGIPLWTTDDNRFKLCSTDARQQQMANVTNVIDVTNAQEQVEVIVSIV